MTAARPHQRSRWTSRESAATTRELRAARRARLLDLARERTAAGRALFSADVASALGCSVNVALSLLASLVADEQLVRLAGRDGWMAADVSAPTATRRRTTLADLITLAREHTDPAAQPKRGRRALHESHDVERITPGQLADIERLAALVLRHVETADGDAARVSDGLFTWDRKLHGGRGGWVLAARARTWAEAEHRAKHEARLSTPWRVELAGAVARDYQGAANNLLHLAATHGRISRSPLSAGIDGTLYAPTWVPVIERWMRAIKRHAGADNVRRTFLGVRCLATYASRSGGADVRSTNWRAVRAALESDLATGTIRRWEYESARYVWRGAVATWGSRLGLGHEFAWPVAGDTRVALVPEEAVRAAVTGDFSLWVDDAGHPQTGLVEGPYGLRAWHLWSTVPDHLLRRQSPPLPARRWLHASSVASRRTQDAPLTVSAATLETRLRMFARLAGWAQTVRGIDWRTADLRTLADPEVVDAFVSWSLALPHDRRGDRRTQLGQTVRTLGWLTNGYLGCQAELLGDADFLGAVEGRYHRLEAIAQELPKADHKDLKKVAAHVREVAGAWRGADQVEGLRKIPRLVEALEAELRAMAGGRTTVEQFEAIRTGAWRPTATWAATLRLIVVLIVAQRVPLRGATVVGLTREMWRSEPVGEAQRRRAVAGALAPWEGALSLDIPGVLMKSKRPFAPPLILARNVEADDHTGSPAHERGLRRDLLALWFVDGGGWDRCRTAVDPDTGAEVRQDVPFLFPDAGEVASVDSETRRGAARRPAQTRRGPRGRKRVMAAAPGQWNRAALSAAFRRAVVRHAAVLAVDPARLRRLRGALGFHVLRRLFGTLWAPVNLVHTSRLLDHTQIELTARIYVASDERTMSLDVAAAG